MLIFIKKSIDNLRNLNWAWGRQCVAEDSCVGGFPDLSKLSVGVPPVVATAVIGHWAWGIWK
ncbi:hypothetical protein FDUTEX481_01316 [Tolypothrix sp. PCC 7601]|nr:hypothetical protein FDUTEX481_01316 [Tolypothrix sp. PCC 7601]